MTTDRQLIWCAAFLLIVIIGMVAAMPELTAEWGR